MSSLFESPDVAELYSKYGLIYPDGVYDLIERKLNESLPLSLSCKGDGKKWNLALDVGCGAGQGSLPLCKFVDKVVGIDNSASQIHYANENHGHKYPGCLSFVCHDATRLSEIFDESSVDLIVVGQALHWFDRVKFYEDCKKVLKPNGLLVAYGSGIFWLEDERTEKIKAELFYPGLLKKWASKEMFHLEDCYALIYPELLQHFPSTDRDDSMTMSTKSSLVDFIKYLSLWSAYRNYAKSNPDDEDILHTIYNRFKDIYQNEEVIIERKSKVFVLTARNE